MEEVVEEIPGAKVFSTLDARSGFWQIKQQLEKEVEWHWEKEQEESFQKLKLMASSTPVLGYYEPVKPVTLSVDVSSKGLSAVVLQDDTPIASAEMPSIPLWQAIYSPVRPQAS
ncbi:hypothetical protein ACROYT_G015856 [Oculina patagonica]